LALIKNLDRFVQKIISKPTNTETRIELKQKLDYFASENLKLLDLQRVLKIGNKRTIEIQDSFVSVLMAETESRFIWKISDPRTAIACLVVTGEYEPLETKILKYFAADGGLVVDIGANVGYYAVELGKILGEKGKLIACEPIPESFEQLEGNVQLNSIQHKVSCYQIAISNFHGSLTLYKPEISGSSASSARNLHPTESSIELEVPVTTLDTLLNSLNIQNCELIKVDVEGAELMVIQGALDSVKRFKPVIFLELLRKWSAQFNYTPNELLEILLPLGYRCFAVSEQLPEIFEISETTIETNFLFVPERKFSDFNHYLYTLRGV